MRFNKEYNKETNNIDKTSSKNNKTQRGGSQEKKDLQERIKKSHPFWIQIRMAHHQLMASVTSPIETYNSILIKHIPINPCPR